MALRVAIGLTAEPSSPQEAAESILPTLPWMVWHDALPEVAVMDQNGIEIARCNPVGPLYDNVPFVEALQATVLSRGEDLAQRGCLTFTFDGSHQELQDADDVLTVSWPGLMNTLNTMAQPTPSALKCTWFFNVDRDRVAALDADGNWQLKPGIAISASPVSLLGANYTSTQVGGDPTVHVHSYSTAEVRAHCKLLELESALAHGLDELDNYWLSIRDSRDDSLLDLATRLETALGPGAILSAINIEEWTDACESMGASLPVRPATVSETKTALDLWKQKRVEAVSKSVANKRRSIIRKALLSDEDTVQVIRQGYLEQAHNTLASLMDIPQEGIRTKVRDDAVASLLVLLRDRLLPEFTPRAPGPCQPDEGIELLVGDELMRLRHEDQSSSPAVDDVAAIQFFGRRSSEVAALDAPDDTLTVEWHALSGARYAVPTVYDGDTTVASTDRVLGVTASYVDQVLYRELTYSGTNLVCRNPMERVHRENLGEADSGEADMMLAQLQRRTCPTWELRALPLRYGDHYEFAASVIDRAGGQATELCLPGQPWAFDPTSISRLSPPQRDRVCFLRRVAVGDCNILPPIGGWPQTPDEVWLRCLEEAPPTVDNVARPTSVLLVPSDRTVFRDRKSVGKATRWPSSVSFDVEAPRLDEHTLLRWNMPATTLEPAAQEAAVVALKAELTAIHRSRDDMLAEGSRAEVSGLPFDPAVTALGVRYRFDGQAETKYILPFKAASITLDCGDADLVEDNAHALRFVIAPGSYVRLGFVPLIAPDDFERMDEQALSRLLEHEPWIAKDGTAYRAFAESVVFAESATAELPDLEASDLLLAADGAGNVELRYVFSRLDADGQRRLRHVHQMRISCERWVWRNLPVPSMAAADAKMSPAEGRRRLASGPPLEIMDAVRRDAPDSELVSYFDELAGLDQGFVRREEVVMRFPRDLSDKIALYVDQRDGIAGADYLRYHLALRSRYLGVLQQQDGDKESPHRVGPRRIAVPFRGNPARIKPPKLLAVLPLIRAMKDSPRTGEKGAGSAFLVILDETWFREYGMGERLRARVAHVKAEIGETTVPPELRYGPLPDHSVIPLKNAALDQRLTEDLDCFGPFGFSLDRGSSQAMANATGFVVYPPAGTPPHYNLFVELTRLLDVPSGALLPDNTLAPLESAVSDALPLYTLPDSHALNPRSNSLSIARLGNGRFSFDASEVASAPFVGASGDVLLQYRYLLIVGRYVRDGGRAVDIFLPEDGLWLSAGDLHLLGGADRDISSCNAAVIAEVLLNGRPGTYEPLGDASSLREFFLMMFGAPDQDAPGMIRRFSQVFDIAFR
ncbi:MULTISPECIES: hypothetical protein [Pseudomonadaceae]|uniref:hypothetical protein n=1 Tax=Pseudomonadaceae TaxID=135621 RepID=UPI00114EBCFC|nr:MULTISPECIES: hypothetical protein [Pseudomonas]MCP1617468.1 hypothetical protein [Pseudomonas otitidis]